MKHYKIFIVDDHPLIRRGLIQLINKQDSLTVTGSASSGPEALEQVMKDPPDLMIIDLTLKNSNGMDLIKDILAGLPGMLILVLSMHDEKVYAERALKAGARGYIMKDAPPRELIKALLLILNGKTYLSESASGRIIEKSLIMSGRDSGGTDPGDILTDRELQVFEMTGQGLTSEEIADKLNIGIKTVDTYKSRIKEKLNIENSAQLTKHAVEWLIHRDS